MSAMRLREALLLRVRSVTQETDRGTSIIMLLLVMVISSGLGAMIISSVVNQDRASRFTQNRVQALATAQAGIDATMARLRTANAAGKVTTGDSGKLPGCDTPITGAVGNNSTYSVTISYFSADPSTLTNTQRTDVNLGKVMVCTSTAGPYNTQAAIRTPRYALINSTGRVSINGTTAARTMETTYNFAVLDQNISGGQIRLYPASTTQTKQWCMDAGSAPAVGTTVYLAECSSSKPPVARQVWAYRADLSIELVSSVSNPNSPGLCIDTNNSPTAHNATKDGNGNVIVDNLVLKRCAIADSAVCNPVDAQANNSTCTASPWFQQWSVDDNAHLEGAKTDQSDIDGYCINAASQTSLVALKLASCVGGTSDAAQTWIPAPSAGAGMSGASNQQLVNFQNFATCLDVTGKNVAASYLILYSCKQNPNPAKVAFNQRFIPSPALASGPTSTLLTVVTGGITYCLKSPGAATVASNPATAYPVLVQRGTAANQCPTSLAGAPATFVWNVSQRVRTDGVTLLPYAERYTIKSAETTSAGKSVCLALGVPNSGNPQYNTAVIASCDGSTSQKWNAVASLSGGTLTNTTEKVTGN